jgi:endoglucanase
MTRGSGLLGRRMLRFALAAIALLACPRAAPAQAPLVRVNTLGYPLAAKKAASVVGGGGAAFRVVRVTDGEPVFQGKASPLGRNDDTGEDLAIVDFSGVRASGEYRVEVDGVGASAPFRVGEGLYREPFQLVTRAMYLWRCGTAVSGDYHGDTFAHGPCHLEDAWLDHAGGGHVQRRAVGGWHDAGDHNKYVGNTGVTVGCMLRAWQDFRPQIEAMELGLPEAGGPLPEFLAEVKWETDWLLTMQADDGSVYHKVSTENYGGMIAPDAEIDLRYFGAWGSRATAEFAAILAMASRHFRPYDETYADRCLAAARESYEFLVAHPEYRRAPNAGFTTTTYDAGGDADVRLWAEAELWEATGEVEFLEALQPRLRLASGADADERGVRFGPRRFRRNRSGRFEADWDWSRVGNLGLLTYLQSQREGRDPELVAALRSSLIAVTDEITATARAHGYARPLGRRYYWGCNGGVARQAVLLEAAARLVDKPEYREVQLDALNHLLGRNVYGRSFVTGLGHMPPMHPHDRRSAGDDVAAPWPGYLIGGPNPRATDWRDAVEEYRTNETAINWNAALIYALAAQLDD